MYNQNGIYYDENHTISFGDVVNNAFSQIANTWSTWHLIPSSRPFVEEPSSIWTESREMVVLYSQYRNRSRRIKDDYSKCITRKTVKGKITGRSHILL